MGTEQWIQLILEGLILLGIIYVAFIQNNVTRIKNSLLNTLKEYPEAAEAFLRMERSRIEEEVTKEVTKEFERDVLDMIKEISEIKKKVIGRVFSTVGPNPLIEKFIDEMEYDVPKQVLKRVYVEMQRALTPPK
jgi:hypothetical protein